MKGIAMNDVERWLWILPMVCFTILTIVYVLDRSETREKDSKFNARIDSVINTKRSTDSLNNAEHTEMMNEKRRDDTLSEIHEIEQDSVIQVLNIRTLPLLTDTLL